MTEQQSAKQKPAYIKVKAAYAKLRTAFSIEQTTYIYGVTGYGKTTLIEHYKPVDKGHYYTCKTGHLVLEKKRGNEKKPGITMTVIDDLQFLRDEQDKKQIAAMTEDPSLWLILLSRSPIPAWLMPCFLQNPFIIIKEEDLWFTQSDVSRRYQMQGMELTPEQLMEVHRVLKGNPFATGIAAKLAEQDGGYRKEQLSQTWKQMEQYLEHAIIEEWEPELVRFLMYICFLDSFTIHLAEMVTGNSRVPALVTKAMELGNFMTEKKGCYQIRPMLKNALYQRAVREWDSNQCRDIYYTAGRYYELEDDVVPALTYYEKSQRHDRIRELLIRNARRNPATGHYFELRRYYLSLTEEEIRQDVILMSGMSMLYSILLEPEKSEYWYEQLKDYEQSQSGGRKREARSRLTYLDIALPHRGSTDILEIIKMVPSMLFDKGMTLPEFSVTSNLPSLMNGGKDFSEWSKKDKEIASSMGKVVSLVLGKYGKGLVGIALAESQYEKGGDDYEILSRLGKGALDAESGGKLEMEFAAAGIQMRMNMFHGNDSAAQLLLEGFEKKAREQQAEAILRNLRAMECRIALYCGDLEAVEKWLLEAPEEAKEFCIMERYRYLTKVRCYLYKEEYIQAQSLLEKLHYYAERYQRTLIKIETQLLLALTRYRSGGDGWQSSFLETVQLAEGYGFSRCICEEGAAIEELWQDKKLREMLPEKNAFYEKLQRETAQMAKYYPKYLKGNAEKLPRLSETALEILRLQAKGLSYPQIAQALDMNLATVKYHCGMTYKKLGVSSKTDAILKARENKLL